jgi:hypothetical protein
MFGGTLLSYEGQLRSAKPRALPLRSCSSGRGLEAIPARHNLDIVLRLTLWLRPISAGASEQ